jgi:RhoGAP domain/LIM domain
LRQSISSGSFFAFFPAQKKNFAMKRLKKLASRDLSPSSSSSSSESNQDAAPVSSQLSSSSSSSSSSEEKERDLGVSNEREAKEACVRFEWQRSMAKELSSRASKISKGSASLQKELGQMHTLLSKLAGICAQSDQQAVLASRALMCSNSILQVSDALVAFGDDVGSLCQERADAFVRSDACSRGVQSAKLLAKRRSAAQSAVHRAADSHNERVLWHSNRQLSKAQVHEARRAESAREAEAKRAAYERQCAESAAAVGASACGAECALVEAMHGAVHALGTLGARIEAAAGAVDGEQFTARADELRRLEAAQRAKAAELSVGGERRRLSLTSSGRGRDSASSSRSAADIGATFLDGERDFVAQLAALREIERDLRSDPRLVAKLGADDIEALFYKTAELHDIHGELLAALDRNVAAVSPSGGDKLMAIANALGPFAQHCASVYRTFTVNFASALDVFADALRRSKSFATFANMIAMRYGADLASILSLPRLRLDTYCQVLNVATRAYPDDAVVADTHRALRAVAADVADKNARADNMLTLLALQRRIALPVEHERLCIAEPHRTLLRRGDAMLLDVATEALAPLHLALFNDMLLLLQPRDSGATGKLLNKLPRALSSSSAAAISALGSHSAAGKYTLLHAIRFDDRYSALSVARATRTVPLSSSSTPDGGGGGVATQPTLTIRSSAPMCAQLGSSVTLVLYDDCDVWHADVRRCIEPPDSGTRMFGVPLELDAGADVSYVLEITCYQVAESGLMEEGLFRKSGASTAIDALRGQLDRGESVDLVGADVHVVAGLLKLWLRSLPEPLATHAAFDRALELGAALKRQPSSPHALAALAELIATLPRPNLFAMQQLMYTLSRVAACAEFNSMSAQNLAVIFSPTLFGSAAEQSGPMMHQPDIFPIVVAMIVHYDAIFRPIERQRAMGWRTRVPGPPPGKRTQEQPDDAAALQRLRSTIGQASSSSSSQREEEVAARLNQLKRQSEVLQRQQFGSVEGEQQPIQAERKREQAERQRVAAQQQRQQMEALERQKVEQQRERERAQAERQRVVAQQQRQQMEAVERQKVVAAEQAAALHRRQLEAERQKLARCNGCAQPIDPATQRGLEALGHVWHDACFRCHTCQGSLLDGFAEVASLAYCAEHYMVAFNADQQRQQQEEQLRLEQEKQQQAEQLLAQQRQQQQQQAPQCSGCSQVFQPGEAAMRALDRIFHTRCFPLCGQCKASLVTGFVVIRGVPFCPNCYSSFQ